MLAALPSFAQADDGTVLLESFETDSAWTVKDAAGKMRAGHALVQGIRPIDGNYYMTSSYDPSPRDARATSPEFSLEAGVTYYVSFYVLAPGYGATLEEFQAMIRNTSTRDATIIADYTGYNAEKISDWKKIEATFVPTKSGYYDMEILHCTQAQDVNLVCFDRAYVGTSPDAYVYNPPAVVTPPDIESESYLYTANSKNIGDYMVKTDFIEGTNDSVFVRGLCSTMPKAWVWGKRSGNSIVFPSKQYIGSYMSNDLNTYDLYFQAGRDFTFDQQIGYVPLDSLVFTLGSDGRYVCAEGSGIVESAEQGSLDVLVDPKLEPFSFSYVYPPDEAAYTRYQFTGKRDDYYERGYQVSFMEDGNDVYVQGFSTYTPYAFLQGTRTEQGISFPAGQYMGQFGDYVIYFRGRGVVNDNGTITYDGEPLTLTDQGDGRFTADAPYVVTISTGDNSFYVVDAELRPWQNGLRKPKPASYFEFIYSTGTPYLEFTYPLVDEEGYVMNTDSLFYRIYVDDTLFTFTPEEYTMLQQAETEINVMFDDNYNFHYLGDNYAAFSFRHEDWQTAAIEMVYHQNGEWLASDRYTIENPLTKVSSLESERYAIRTTRHNIMGQQIAPNARGIVIETTYYSDGTRESRKVLK